MGPPISKKISHQRINLERKQELQRILEDVLALRQELKDLKEALALDQELRQKLRQELPQMLKELEEIGPEKIQKLHEIIGPPVREELKKIIGPEADKIADEILGPELEPELQRRLQQERDKQKIQEEFNRIRDKIRDKQGMTDPTWGIGPKLTKSSENAEQYSTLL